RWCAADAGACGPAREATLRAVRYVERAAHADGALEGARCVNAPSPFKRHCHWGLSADPATGGCDAIRARAPAAPRPGRWSGSARTAAGFVARARAIPAIGS